MSLNIPKQASESADGTFCVRTAGLGAHRQAELEIVGIPVSAVEAAAKLIDYVVESVIERGQTTLKPGENVGLPLSVAGDDRFPGLFIGVHAAESEPPSGGFLAKLFGSSNRGTIRLLDLYGPRNTPPLAALATMMLFRANCRVAIEDTDGAIEELRAAIEMVPGDPAAGVFGDPTRSDVEVNWQNLGSYLRLAEIVGGDEADQRLATVFSRFDWLSRRELGCSPAELVAIGEAELFEEAAKILRHNLANPRIGPGPHAALRLVASPLWSRPETATTPSDAAVRQVTVIPAGFVDYYFGDRLTEPEAAEQVARCAAQCVRKHAAHPWKVSSMTRGARELYVGAALSDENLPGSYHPAHFLLSAVMAEAARYLHAGATPEELSAVFELTNSPAAPSESLATKLADLESWEGQQYSAALSP
jgi:hypothetical protein